MNINRIIKTTVSPKNLALFRIVFGLAILFHISLFVLPGISINFFSNGLFTKSTLATLSQNTAYSIFDYIQSDFLVVIVFVITYLFLFSFILGFHSRISGIMLTFLLWNIFQRCIFSGGAERTYCICILLLSNFINLDQAFALRINTKPFVNQSLALRAISLQVGIIYLCAAVLKSDISWYNGEIFQHILSDPLNVYSIWHGKEVKSLSTLSIAIICIECMIGAIFIILPKNHFVRMLGCTLLLICHLSIITFLNLWHFAFYACALAILFWPNKETIRFSNMIYDTKKAFFSTAALAIYLVMVMAINGTSIYFSKNYPRACRFQPLTKIGKVIKQHRFASASPFSQEWGLYGNIPEQFGCITFVGLNDANNMVNLVSGNLENNTICCDYNNLFQKEHLEILRLIYLYMGFERTREPMLLLLSSYKDYYKRKYKMNFKYIEMRFYFFEEGDLKYKILLRKIT